MEIVVIIIILIIIASILIEYWYIVLPIVAVIAVICIISAVASDISQTKDILNKVALPPKKYILKEKKRFSCKAEQEAYEKFGPFLDCLYIKMDIDSKINVLDEKIELCKKKNLKPLSDFQNDKRKLEKKLNEVNSEIFKYKLSDRFERRLKEFNSSFNSYYDNYYRNSKELSSNSVFSMFFSNVKIKYAKDGSMHLFFMVPFYIVYDEKDGSFSLKFYKGEYIEKKGSSILNEEFLDISKVLHSYLLKNANGTKIERDIEYEKKMSEYYLYLSSSGSYVNGMRDYSYIYILYFPSTAKYVNNKAFMESTSFNEVVFNKGLSIIHEDAFRRTKISEIEIPEYVSICERAFRDCTSLKRVVINKDCHLSNSAFYNCYNIDELIFNGTSFINNTSFAEVNYVKRLELLNMEGNWSSIDQIKKLVKKRYSMDIVLSTLDGFKGMSYNIFSKEFLPHIIELTYINVCGQLSGYYNLPKLETLKFSKVSSLSSFNYSFNNLKNVTFDSECTLRKIPKDAFKNNPSLETAIFPKFVNSIDSNAFTNCPKLSQIGTNEKGVLVIDGSIKFAKDALGECKIKEVVISTPNVDLDIVTLVSNMKPSKITVPSNIDGKLFAKLLSVSSLKEVYVTNVKGDVKFYVEPIVVNDKIQVLQLPDSIQTFNSFSISKKNSLTRLELSQYQLDVDKGLIDLLNSKTKLTLSKYVFDIDDIKKVAKDKDIDIKYFKQNIDFSEVVVDRNTKVHSGDISIRKIIIKDDVTEILPNMFSNCFNIREVIIEGNNLSKIGKGAFSSCYLIKEIKLPKALKYIDEEAFMNCTSLNDIDISNVLDIGTKAFMNCEQIKNVTFNDEVYNVGAFAFENTGINTIDLPKNLSSLSEGSFKNCKGLKNINFNDNIKIISKSLFEGTGLVSIDLPESVILMMEGAFKNCEKLKSVKLHKGIRSISKECFAGCNKLKDLSFIEEIEEIKEGAFKGCSSIETVELPMQLKIVGKEAFKDCFKLVEVYVPSSVYKFEAGCFEGCLRLKRLKGMNKIQIVERNVFNKCNSLNELVFPRALRIFDNPIYECKALKTLIFTDDLEKLNLVINKESKLDEIIVPNEIKDYKLTHEYFRIDKKIKFKLTRGSTCSLEKNSNPIMNKEYYKKEEFELMIYDILLEHGYTVGFSEKKIKFKKVNSDPSFDFGHDAFNNNNMDLNLPKKEKKRADWDTVVVKEADEDKVEQNANKVKQFIVKENVEFNFSVSSFGTCNNENFSRLIKESITSNIFDISYKIKEMENKKLYISLFNKKLERVSTINYVEILKSEVDNLNIKFELLNNATNSMCLLVVCDENLNIVHSDYYMIDRLIVMDDEFDIF